jgi:hypothetical protein
MDADHINGLVPLFRAPPRGFAAREVWFNSLCNLPDSDLLGYQKADQLAAVLSKGWPQAWNASWSDSPRKAVVIPDPPEPLPVRNIAGLKITLLSPTTTQLRSLTQEWPAAVRAAKLAEEQAQEPPSAPSDKLGRVIRDVGTPLEELATMSDDEWDKSRPNGSSIAFLASYEGRVLLLAADAHADVLAGTLRRVHGGQAVRADACTLPHHGSRANVKADLLTLIDCSTWLISTNGNLHGHPDRRAIGRILRKGTNQVLVFNYLSASTREYGLYSTVSRFDCTAHHPAEHHPGMAVDIGEEGIIVTSLYKPSG